MARRTAKEEAPGKKLGGKPSKAPEPGARDSGQINLTNEDSRIMPVAGGGFAQAHNAQARVDAATMLATLKARAGMLGPVESLIADMGFCSEKNIKACKAAGIDPVIAVARDEHHPGWGAQHSEPTPLPENATPVHALSHCLKTKAGQAPYALRKQTVEPVFGIIKSVMGFRRFSLRGLRKVTGEWTLVCLARNVKRMARLLPQ